MSSLTTQAIEAVARALPHDRHIAGKCDDLRYLAPELAQQFTHEFGAHLVEVCPDEDFEVAIAAMEDVYPEWASLLRGARQRLRGSGEVSS